MSAINCLPSDKGIDIHIVHDKAFEHANGVLAVKPVKTVLPDNFAKFLNTCYLTHILSFYDKHCAG